MSRKKTGREGLLHWLKARTQGYENVEVVDFTDSWSDGLAFCAVLHSYCPNLINYKTLKPEKKLHNLSLAFSTAEKLGIPRLMLPEDLLAESGPDKFCVITYLAQFVDFFRAQEPTPIPRAPPAPLPSPPTDTLKQFEERRESKMMETERRHRLKRSLKKFTGTDVVQSGIVAEKVSGYEMIYASKFKKGDSFIVETVPTGLVAERIASFLKFQEKMKLDVEFIMVTTSPRRRRKLAPDSETWSPRSQRNFSENINRGPRGGRREGKGAKVASDDISSIFYVMRDANETTPNVGRVYATSYE